MQNNHFTGEWEGVFSETPSGGTPIAFTENIRMKNPVLELISHFFLNLKKMQMAYVRDLRAVVEKKPAETGKDDYSGTNLAP